MAPTTRSQTKMMLIHTETKSLKKELNDELFKQWNDGKNKKDIIHFHNQILHKNVSDLKKYLNKKGKFHLGSHLEIIDNYIEFLQELVIQQDESLEVLSEEWMKFCVE